MFTIQIQDEELASKLQQIAVRENRPMEDVLKTLIAQYDKNDAVRRVRNKAYTKARSYWSQMGETAKAELTNDELDEQFGVFDKEGIPRLKSELESLNPPVGSMAYAAQIAREADIQLGSSDIASRAEEILDQEFADYLLKWQKDDNDPKQNSR